jgi:type IX secretion system PorP/SprF family membrane protein
MKKTLILIVFVLFGIGTVLAQQVPLYSHYYYNKFLYNPSLAGGEDYGQLYLIHRNQWNSLPGAPQTQAVTVDGPLRSKKVGLGLGVYRDVAGQFNVTGAQASYRYSIDFNDDNRLNFGLGLGIVNTGINLNDLIVKHITDPIIVNSYQNATGFDANFGVSYKMKDFLIGVSIPQIIGNELAYSSLTNPISGKDVRYGLIRHYITHASYNWDIQGDGKWFLEPNVMLRVTPGAPVQFDFSTMFSYMKRYWVGGMLRSNYAVTASAGMRLADQFVAGYAYDIAIHSVSQYTRGAHEVMLGYQFGGNQVDGKKIEKNIDDINDRLNKTDKELDSLGNEVKKNRGDIDQNTDDIETNDGELDEIRSKIKTFEDFMKKFDKANGGAGAGTGEVFTFNNVYFETNKWDINPRATPELDNLVEILIKNPSLKIEVAGHADPRGSDSYNLWLSNKRSNAVRDYLIRKGVSPAQLDVKGYGEGTAPAGSALDEERRVEFKILAQ